MCADSAGPGSHQRGLSLLELLVALLLSLLLVLAAVGVATTFSAAQRQSVSASATSAELTSTLAALKGDIASAALGFTAGGASRCVRWNLAEGGVAVADNAPFLPFAVTRDATGRFDKLEVILATDVRAASSVRLAASAGPSAANLLLRGWLPVQSGDRVLVAPESPGAACSVREVTGAVDGTPGVSYAYTLQVAGSTFSAPVGGYLPNDTVSVLGRIDQRTLEVDDFGRLLLTSSLLGGAAPVPLVEGVMAWRVQYGVAGTADTADSIEWVDPVGPWASLDSGSVRRVRALRLGLLARSPQREKGCQATTSLPSLFGSDVDVSASDPVGWRCYRYRRAEVVVPLRNQVWGNV
jgi:type IV pilus assembly protein PilW